MNPQQSQLTKEALAEFLAELPMTIGLLGREFTISHPDRRRLEVRAGEIFNCDVTNLVFEYTRVQVERHATKNNAKSFLEFFLRTPIGAHLLATISRRGKARSSFPLNAAFTAWLEQQAPRDENGNFKSAVICVAYSTIAGRADETCNNATKHASGLCHHHRQPDVNTLWNFYPFDNV